MRHHFKSETIVVPTYTDTLTYRHNLLTLLAKQAHGPGPPRVESQYVDSLPEQVEPILTQ